MWKTEGDPLIIDLGHDFFIVKLSRREENDRALMEAPWMIGDNYLHIQRWRPIFIDHTPSMGSLSNPTCRVLHGVLVEESRRPDWKNY